MSHSLILASVFMLILGLIISSSSAQNQDFINIPTATPAYLLSYIIEDDKITFEVTAETKGFIGFGFSNISGMVSSDIFVGGVKDDGSLYFGDYTGITTGAPKRDAEENWDLIEATESETSTYVKFSRLLSTGDLADIIIEDKLMNVIWSIGTKDELSYHGFSRSTLTYNLISQTNGGVDPNPPPTQFPPETTTTNSGTSEITTTEATNSNSPETTTTNSGTSEITTTKATTSNSPTQTSPETTPTDSGTSEITTKKTQDSSARAFQPMLLIVMLSSGASVLMR